MAHIPSPDRNHNFDNSGAVPSHSLTRYPLLFFIKHVLELGRDNLPSDTSPTTLP